MTLVPEGSYRLEAQLAAIAKLKLTERPGKVADAEEATLDSSPTPSEDRQELV